MSVEAMSWAFQQEALSTTPRFVLVALANRADEDGYCWPGLEDLERRTGLTDRAIQKAVKLMVERQLLTISPRFHSNGRQKSNLYRLCLPSSGKGEPRSPQRVNQSRGKGEPRSPESSSEQSDEQSDECREGAQSRPLPRHVAKSVGTWEGYRKGYRKRYGVDPVRDARVNADLCKLVDRLGEESGSVAEFYVELDRPLYVQAGHPTNLLVRDYQALRTQWKMGAIRAPLVGPKSFQPVPRVEKSPDKCPPEAAAALSKILGREAFSFSGDSKEAV